MSTGDPANSPAKVEQVINPLPAPEIKAPGGPKKKHPVWAFFVWLYSYLEWLFPYVVLISIATSLLLFAVKNAPAAGSLADQVVQLYGLTLLVLMLSFLLLLLAAFIKLGLKHDSQKRKARQKIAQSRKEELGRDDPCLNASQRRWRGGYHLVCHEIGVALFVAGLVTALFEGTFRLREEERRHKEQKTMQEDVFQGVFGHSIDRSIIKEVLTGVLQSPIQREDMDVDFHFCCADVKKQYLQVHVTVTYRLRNMTQKTIYLPDTPIGQDEGTHTSRAESGPRIPYEIRHFFQNVDSGGTDTDCFYAFSVSDELLRPIFSLKPKELAEARAEAIKAAKSKAEKVDKEDAQTPSNATEADAKEGVRMVGLAGQENEFDGHSERTDFIYSVGAKRQQITIKKRLPIESGQSLLISYAYQVTRRHSDFLVYSATLPTTSFQFTVSKGDGVPDLRYDVESTHSRRPVRVSPAEQKFGIGETYKFRVPTAMLPGQGIELYWYPWSDSEMKTPLTAEAKQAPPGVLKHDEPPNVPKATVTPQKK